MKTKKVLALVVLAAFLISIVPFAAFAAVDQYNSSIDAPTDTVSAVGTATKDDDGAEFDVVIVGSGSIYVASSRATADSFFYKLGGEWKAVPASGEIDATMTSVLTEL